MEALAPVCNNNSRDAVVQALRGIVPEFQPENHN